jgi:hypothetical protein
MVAPGSMIAGSAAPDGMLIPSYTRQGSTARTVSG